MRSSCSVAVSKKKTDKTFFAWGEGVAGFGHAFSLFGERSIKRDLTEKLFPVGYYNYHAVARRLIKEGHLVRFVVVGDWNGIKPALVLFFDNHIPMPVRQERWVEYMFLWDGTNKNV